MNKKIKEEFEKRYPELKQTDIWSFISKALKQAREDERTRILGIVEGIIEDNHTKIGTIDYEGIVTDLFQLLKKSEKMLRLRNKKTGRGYTKSPKKRH